jgi:hypothetical protein
MTATANPALTPALNPESPFDCVSLVLASYEEPKPSFIVLLSGTVILQECDQPPCEDGLLLHGHEGINIQRNTEWIADGDLMLHGCVKPSARVRHKLRPFRIVVDSKASCLGLTVERDLIAVRVGFREPVRYEINGRAIKFNRRERLL